MKNVLVLMLFISAGVSAQTITFKKNPTFNIEELDEYAQLETRDYSIYVDDEKIGTVSKKSVITIDGKAFKGKEARKKSTLRKFFLAHGYKIAGTNTKTRSWSVNGTNYTANTLITVYQKEESN